MRFDLIPFGRLPFVLGGCFLLAATVFAAAPQSGSFNVRQYGATGDGKTLDSAAINKAIDAAAAQGGGTVFFPAGTYVSGSIHLKSHITLYLDSGATILGAANDIHAYDNPEPNAFEPYQDFGHDHWHNSLIWGENLTDIAILGQGTINGGGMTRSNKVPDGGGDKILALKLCRNINLRDIVMQHGGHFAILLTGCDNVAIENLKIDTDRDGMDIDSCRNVRVTDCAVNSPRDDGICPKSSYALGYPRATENVTITGCLVSGFDEGTMLDGTFKRSHHGATGRIKCGTESNGGFKNITIANCVFDHCCGLALETVDGGNLENITVSNIAMHDIQNSPIFIRLGARARGPNNPAPGVVKNINISNVLVTGADTKSASIIAGIPGHDIQNVTLNNIRVETLGGGTKDDAGANPPELVKGYPEPGRFGTIPAYGFFCRHVSGIEFHNVNLAFDNADMRPAFVFDQVSGVDLDHVKAEQAKGAEPTFRLTKVKDFTLENCPGMEPRAFKAKENFAF